MTTVLNERNDFDHLPPFQKRGFVTEAANLSNPVEVCQFYQDLLDRNISSSNELKRFLVDRSELEAVLDQHSSVLYIRMTTQTDDSQRAGAYKEFIEKVIPAIKPLEDQLDRKYLSLKKQYPLDDDYYNIYDKGIQMDVDLFVEKNIPLQTQVSLLSQEYQTICGAITVEFQGEERTLPQMSKFLLEPDRELREAAWRASAERRLQERSKFDELFDKMVVLRAQIASNAGCKNFEEYQFKAYHRFDYTPEHSKKYHKAIEECVVPIWKEILERRRAQMKLDKLRPWDTAVDPLGRAALKPFSKVEDLITDATGVFKDVDKELGAQFSDMAQLGLLDLESRKGKAPGGYQSVLAEARKPFIFMNAVGVDQDIWTILHEGGHAFHALAKAHHPVFAYRHAPMEFCEVASMGMELLGSEYLSKFYDEQDAKRSQLDHLEDIVFTLAWVANIDAFQQWIYQNPKHTAQERSKAWLDIHHRFGGDFVDWTGIEEHHASLWHRQLHIFEVPFYYIEYGIAQIGALQLWLNAKSDRSKAIADYRKAFVLGGSRPLPEIFETAGLKFSFSKETIAPLMEAVKQALWE